MKNDVNTRFGEYLHQKQILKQTKLITMSLYTTNDNAKRIKSIANFNLMY